MKAKAKSALKKVAHLVLSPAALAIEKPLLKKLLVRYGVTAATAGVVIAELVDRVAKP